MNKKVKTIGCVIFPVFILVLYLAVAEFASGLLGDSVLASLAADGMVIAVGIFVYLWNCRKLDSVKGEHFRPRAWAVMLWILCVVVLWFITQCMSLCITLHVTDTGLERYTDSIQSNVALWAVLAVLVAPAAEELIFRGCLYGVWQKRFGWFIPAIVSSLFFVLIHGTLVHIPIAFLMGMFHIAVWEVSGEFKYPILSHMIYNFLSLGLVIPIGQDVADSFLCSIWFNVFIGVLMFAGAICLYVWREKIRVFMVTPNIIDRLNRKGD